MFCTKSVLVIALGIIALIIGFIMTMYGHFAKPFFSKSSESFCDFCKDERDTVERNAANCRIAGPVFMCIGFIVIVIGVILKRKYNETLAKGTVITYNTTTTTNTSYPPNQPYPNQQQPYSSPYQPPMGGYPQTATQFGYPQQQAPYPPAANPQYQQSPAYPPPNYQSQTPNYSSVPEKSGQPAPPPPSYDAAVATPTAPTEY